MKANNKKTVLKVLFQELEKELEYDNSSQEVFDLIHAIEDFITSYYKGWDKTTELMILNDTLKEYDYSN